MMDDFLSIVKKNYRIVICFIVLFFCFSLMVFFWIGKRTFSTTDFADVIQVVCPLKTTEGEKIECLIKADFSDKSILSVNANYNFSGLVLNSFVNLCDSDNCFSTLASNNHGFAIGNVNELTGGFILGKVLLDVYSVSEEKDGYEFKLTNIELCDKDYNIIELEDINVTIGVKSNVASLSGLSLKYEGEDEEYVDVKLDKKFSSTTYEYKAEVSKDIDHILIGYTKTENSVVSGPVGVSTYLHYGMNVFDVKVTSEDGKSSVTYTVSVLRKYEFNTESYEYNKDKNYMYVGADNNESILDNLETLDDDLSYNITSDDKLEVKYGTEILASVELLRLKSEYSIVDKVIYIVNNLTYRELLDKIKSDKLTVKVVDSKNKEMNKDTSIDKSNKLNVYFGTTLIDTYTFASEYFELGSDLIIDDTNKIIKRIPLGTKYNSIKEKISANGEISILSNDLVVTDMDDIVKTGDKIIIQFTGEKITYTLSVLGDLNGDGMVKVNDVDILYRGLKGRRELTKIESFAGDIINGGNIKVNDVDKLYRYLKGRITSLEAVE